MHSAVQVLYSFRVYPLAITPYFPVACGDSMAYIQYIKQVLKCIMLREGYLERLKRLAEAFEREIKQGHGRVQVLPPGMIDLLELLRSVTLDTVEAISFWRLSQVREANAFAPPTTAIAQDSFTTSSAC